MTEGYAERRREYVARIRNSFDTEENTDGSGQALDQEESPYTLSRLPVLAAGCIFVLFLFLKFTGTDIYGYHSEDIINLIADNHYYTSMMEYDAENLIAAFAEKLNP